jgi:hypothetical protein
LKLLWRLFRGGEATISLRLRGREKSVKQGFGRGSTSALTGRTAFARWVGIR